MRITRQIYKYGNDGQPKLWPGLKFLGQRKKNCKCRKCVSSKKTKHECASDIPSCDISENYDTISRRHSIAKMGWNQLYKALN